MTKYSILGSCVTRDIFSAMDKDSLIGDYRARTSLHTLFLPGIEESNSPDLSNVESPWQRRMIEFDLTKKPLNLAESEFLIIDFIDDRFQKIWYQGVLVTKSREFSENVATPDQYEVAFTQGSEEDLIHWTESCRRFSNFIKQFNIKIILHKSRFAIDYLEDGEFKGNPNRSFIDRMNTIISKYEDIFMNEIDNVSLIKVELEHVISDPTHRWGLAPFHYIDSYYQSAWKQIKLLS